MYPIIRFLHLLLMASVLPFSFLYVRLSHPGIFAEASGMTIFLVAIGALFINIFYISFQQRYYPDDLKQAFIGFAFMSANMLAATTLASGQFFFGGFSVGFRIVLSYFIYYGIMTGYFWMPALRNKYFHYTNNAYSLLLIFFFIGSGLLLYLLLDPLTGGLSSYSSMPLLVTYLATLGMDVSWNIKDLFRNNMFQYDNDGKREQRDKTLTAWGLPIVLLIIASTVGVVVVMVG